MRPAGKALVGMTVCLLLSGCGGSGSARYSKPAMVKCLNDHGVGTQDLSDPVTASDKRVADLLRPIAPNMIAAKFNGNEFVGIAFAADASGATRIHDAFKKLANAPGATAGKIVQTGNLVILENLHPTAGTTNTLADCEEQAKIT